MASGTFCEGVDEWGRVSFDFSVTACLQGFTPVRVGRHCGVALAPGHKRSELPIFRAVFAKPSQKDRRSDNVTTNDPSQWTPDELCG